MTTDIFLVTFGRDAPFVPYLLSSIQKFCRGFNEVVVAIPEHDGEHFKGMDFMGARTCYYPEEGDGFIHHQGMKCHADKFCKGDFILHMDSDCLFVSETNPQEYFQDGKPMILMAPYASLPGTPWQACTQKVLGFPVENEFMRRHPSVYRRDDYGAFRLHVQQVHGKSLMEYLKPITRHMGADSFSEFNALGAFMHKHRPHEYRFLNTETDGWPESHVGQWWTHGGLDWKSDRAPYVGRSFIEVARELGL